MIVPGIRNTAGGLDITVGAGIVPDFINQGFGFMNSGALAVDSNPPVGNVYVKGFRMSPAGAVYGLTVPDFGAYLEGIFRNNDGRLVYDPVSPIFYTSGNPITVNDLLAVI